MSLSDRIKQYEELPDHEVIQRMIAIENSLRYSLGEERQRLIAVEGNIGTGKSTLVRLLGTKVGLKPFLEDVDSNPIWRSIIDTFYKDRVKYGTTTQLALLAARLAQAKQAYQVPGSAIIDRTYWADLLVFVPTLAEAGLPKGEQKFIEREFMKFVGEFPPVDLLILLTSDPKTAHQRLVQRARGSEMATDLAGEVVDENHYLTKIGDKYKALPDGLRERKLYTGPIITVDQDQFKVTNSRHTTALLEEVATALQVPGY